ncbi:hypothetical protein [[Phormidium] sp. ETS-05]|uniref:hypothetical protein n=1 Tax=[Phormidium] sp. ETS-05 TaxID=222819 RepID=UPI0018EF089B|nr:hypothetical protein [[Phormidium] sp. ETS-05]
MLIVLPTLPTPPTPPTLPTLPTLPTPPTEISLRCAALPDCDRSMDEILGYDEFGLPS